MGEELRLIQKSKKGPAKLIFSRTGMVLLLMAVCALALFAVFTFFVEWLAHIVGGVELFSLIVITTQIWIPQQRLHGF